MYVIFDLDDTLVHSDAVRARVRRRWRASTRCPSEMLSEVLDTLPGRPAREIFEALGPRPPPRPLRHGPLPARARRAQRLASRPSPTRTPTPSCASSPPAAPRSCSPRAHRPSAPSRVLEQEGWDAFQVVLGSEADCRKGAAHYDRIAAHADLDWTRRPSRSATPRPTCASAPSTASRCASASTATATRAAARRGRDPRRRLARRSPDDPRRIALCATGRRSPE